MTIADNPKLAALMAAIKADVVIRRRKDGKPTVENSVTRAKREERERGTDPALRDLMRRSNLDARGYKPQVDRYALFREVAKTTLLQKQFCRCCESVQINVVAEMVHLRGRVDIDAPIADVWVRRSSVQALPHEEPLFAPSHSVEFCADCILTAQQTECWAKPTTIPDANGQLPLIH